MWTGSARPGCTRLKAVWKGRRQLKEKHEIHTLMGEICWRGAENPGESSDGKMSGQMPRTGQGNETREFDARGGCLWF